MDSCYFWHVDSNKVGKYHVSFLSRLWSATVCTSGTPDYCQRVRYCSLTNKYYFMCAVLSTGTGGLSCGQVIIRIGLLSGILKQD